MLYVTVDRDVFCRACLAFNDEEDNVLGEIEDGDGDECEGCGGEGDDDDGDAFEDDSVVW